MTKRSNHLKGGRAYLSGPMDFVASRAEEKRYGWRNRVAQFLKSYGVTVFDPWSKPRIRGLYEYGREDVNTLKQRDQWTYGASKKDMEKRGEIGANFWETLHIDLRMVDVCDFVIAYCPTNVYSVGTVHEIVVARLESKPVLLVSPRVSFPAFEELKREASGDVRLRKLVRKLERELPLKENSRGIPSLWYMPLVGSENIFDSFGFTDSKYKRKFRWTPTTQIDKRELSHPPQKPLLPFLEQIACGKFPKRWDHRAKKLIPDDDWLLMEQALSTKAG